MSHASLFTGIFFSLLAWMASIACGGDRPLDEKQVAIWIAELGSRNFAQRERANEALEKLGDALLHSKALVNGLSSKDPEVVQRLERLLERYPLSAGFLVERIAQRIIESASTNRTIRVFRRIHAALTDGDADRFDTLRDDAGNTLREIEKIVFDGKLSVAARQKAVRAAVQELDRQFRDLGEAIQAPLRKAGMIVHPPERFGRRDPGASLFEMNPPSASLWTGYWVEFEEQAYRVEFGGFGRELIIHPALKIKEGFVREFFSLDFPVGPKDLLPEGLKEGWRGAKLGLYLASRSRPNQFRFQVRSYIERQEEESFQDGLVRSIVMALFDPKKVDLQEILDRVGLDTSKEVGGTDP